MPSQLTFPSGRTIDYESTGPSNTSFALLYIHGTPSAYHQPSGLVSACAAKNIRLISYSRAGYGGSSRHQNRKIVDVVPDIQALLQHLGITECVVMGWSGGGPHTLACAARLPGVKAVTSVAGVAPWGVEGLDWLEGQGQDNIDETHASLQGEVATQAFCNAQRPDILSGTVEGIISALETVLPPADKHVLLTNKTMAQDVVATMSESVRVSVDGWVDDDLAFVQPWGFELEEIKVPVFLYQGSEDKMVPTGHGKWLAEHLPQERLQWKFLEGEGHISIFIGREQEMVDELLAAAKA